jgi:hypothetical protein
MLACSIIEVGVYELWEMGDLTLMSLTLMSYAYVLMPMFLLKTSKQAERERLAASKGRKKAV